MKTYFITSDIHSFYTPFIEALNNSGFDLNNKEHILIIAGDLMDRGSETIKLLKFIKSLPKDRRILIKGNHEDLLIDCFNRKQFLEHDIHNGTNLTIHSLVNLTMDKNKYCHSIELYADNKNLFFDCLAKTGIIEWINSDEWLDYLETDNYIITHSFIPVINKVFFSPGGRVDKNDINYMFEYDKDWRNASSQSWKCARWFNAYDMIQSGLFKENKKLICGHISSLIYKNESGQLKLFNYDKDTFKKYYTPFENNNMICLDACTALSNKVNVLKLTEEELGEVIK